MRISEGANMPISQATFIVGLANSRGDRVVMDFVLRPHRMFCTMGTQTGLPNIHIGFDRFLFQ